MPTHMVPSKGHARMALHVTWGGPSCTTASLAPVVACRWAIVSPSPVQTVTVVEPPPCGDGTGIELSAHRMVASMR